MLRKDKNINHQCRQDVDWSSYASSRILSRNRLLYAQHAEIIENFLLMFGQVDLDKKILDIGPANGFFMVLLRELGFLQVEGLEISSVFTEILCSKNLKAFCGDIVSGEGLEKLSNPYDYLLMMDVIEHIQNPEQALRNVKNMLAPGGYIYLTVPICDCIFSKIFRVLRGKTRKQLVCKMDKTHIHAFSKKQLFELLEKVGFDVCQMRRLSFIMPFFFKNRFVRRSMLLLRAMLPSFLKGAFLEIIAKRNDGNYDD